MEYTIIDFEFENKNGTDVIGQIHLKIDKGIFYKPSMITIQSGLLDKEFLSNTGKNSLKHREFKEEIIKKYTKNETSSRPQVINKSFVLGENIGLVSAMSKMNGFNANRNGLMKIKILGKEYTAAKLFQNLKSASGFDGMKFIAFEQIEKTFHEEIMLLIANYNKNIKTSSSVKQEEK